MCDFRKPEDVLAELEKRGITVTFKGSTRFVEVPVEDGLYYIIASGCFYVLYLDGKVQQIF